MLKITKENFNDVIKNNETIIIDFWADWCSPCIALGPLFENVSKNYPHITCGKVNVDEEEELAMGFEVRSIPYVVKIKNGKIIDSFTGLRTEAFIEEFFNR